MHRFRILLAIVLLAVNVTAAQAADVVKANNTTNLNLAGSWGTGGPPGAGDTAVFDSTYAQSSATDLLTGAALSWGGVRITSGSNLVSINNGPANDVTIGSGGVDMSAASRNFTLQSFQLNVNHTWSIASGRTFTVGGRGFTQNSGAVVTISGSGTVVQQTTGTFTVGNLATFTGTLSTAADTVLTVGSGSAFSLAGTISGAGSVTKAGAGTYTLTGSTSHTGGTIVSAGTLALGAAERLANTGALTVSGGVFSLGNFAETVGTVTLTGGSITSGTLTGSSYAVQAGEVSANLAGSGSLTKTGAGTVSLSAGNTYVGTTTVSSGTLLVTDSGAIGSGSLVVSNGALAFNRSAATTIANSLTAQGAGSAPALLNNGTGLLTLQVGSSGNITVDNGETFSLGGSGQVRIEKSIASGGNSSLVTKVGSGTVTLTSASNAWSGGTTISEGVLQVGDGVSNGTIGSGTITITNGRLAFHRPAAYTVGEPLARFTAGTTPGIDNNGSGTLTINSSGLIFESGAQLTFGGAGVGVVSGDIAPLNAAASMVKDGSGRWTFDGDNGYTGTTTVNAGTLEITGRLGTGSYAQAIAINGGVLSMNSSSNQTLSGTMTGAGNLLKANSGALTLSAANTFSGTARVAAGTLNLGNVSALAGSTLDMVAGDTGTIGFTVAGVQTYALGGLQGSRNLAIGGNSIVVGGNNTDTIYSGIVSGSGALTKTGNGTFTLSGSNTYSGGTVVSAGRLVGTTQSLQGGITNNAAVEFAQATSGTYAGVISGSGTVLKTGAGTVTLAGSNSFSGVASITAGTLKVGNGGTAGSLGGGNVVNDGELAFSRSDAVTVAGNVSGVGSVTQAGTGTTTLSGSNSYTGNTSIAQGTLSLGSANAIGSAGSIVFGGGKLQYTAANTTDYSSRFIGGFGVGNYAIDTNGQSVTFASPLGGNAGLDKFGTGILTLTGSNTFFAPTRVFGGILRFNGNSSGVVDAVDVYVGATLGGTGRIGGAVNINVGGVLDPGASVESLETGPLTFNGGSLAYEVDSSAALAIAGDLLVVRGNLSIGAATPLTLTDLAGDPGIFPVGTTLSLINYTGTWNNGLFAYGGMTLADGGTFTAGLTEWMIDYNASAGGANFASDQLGGNFVNITAVPEPSTYAMALAGLACGGFSMWRRRKRA